MKKFNKVDISSYPAHILKGYSDAVKRKLADQAIAKKDYDGFKHIIDNMDYLSFLSDAIESLDIKLLKIILEKAKDIEWYKNGSFISKYDIKNIFEDNWSPELNDIENIEEKRVEILKALLEFKDKEEISLYDLQKLADHVSQQEFEDFCKTKELDLTIEKFKDLELSQYKFSGLEPLLKLENGNNTLVDLLLSRTFSDKLSLQDIKAVYTKLYNLDPIAKEMLAYTAALISQNNSIKILFVDTVGGAYSPEQNIIKISNSFANESIFNIESVVIHEIGHFIYDQIFKNEAMPFDYKELRSFIKSFYEEYKEEIEDPFQKHSFNYKIFADKEKALELSNKVISLAKFLMDYEKAARAPIDKAAELLGIDKAEYSKYLFASEYTEYLKHNSYIDLFELNALGAFKTDKDISTKEEDHVFDNILNIYLSEQNVCNLPYSAETTREDIVKWAVEERLPKLVKELSLTPEKIHYLDRMADYTNRANHLLDDKWRDSDDMDEEKYVELIVRSMELKAAELDKELTDAFQGLDAFHIQYVSPDICSVIQASEVAAMPFDIGMIGETYVCLSNEV